MKVGPNCLWIGPSFAMLSFPVTASEKCHQEKRKTVNGEDILFAMTSLGFENYAEALKIYLAKYREVSIFSAIVPLQSLVYALIITHFSFMFRHHRLIRHRRLNPQEERTSKTDPAVKALDRAHRADRALLQMPRHQQTSLVTLKLQIT